MFKNLNIFRSLIAILILFIPLYPKFPLANVNGTYVAIRLDDIVVGSAILIWCLYQLFKKFPVFKIKITKLFIVYLLAIIASAINAILIYQTDPKNILLLNTLRRFEYMSLFFIAINSIRTVKDLIFPYISLLIATALVDFFAYGQKYLHFPVISTMNSEFSKGQLLQMDVWTRVSSTFAGHYDLAAFLSVALVIIGVFIIINKNIPLKIASILIWLASFQILTFTASRVSTFAFWGGICLTLILLRKYIWTVPVTLLVIFSIVNSKDLNQRLMATIPALKNQLAFLENKNKPTAIPTPIAIVTPEVTPTSGVIGSANPTPPIIRHGPIEEIIPIDADVGVARSGEIRFKVEWPRAINAFKKNLALGTGLGSLTLATDNDFLRLLGESGLIGFIAFMAIQMYFIFKTLPFIFKKKHTASETLCIIFLGCQLTTLANAVFIDVFEASKTAYLFWLMMGVFYQSLEFVNKNDAKN
jgi:uncharacterized membrane protein YwzB